MDSYTEQIEQIKNSADPLHEIVEDWGLGIGLFKHIGGISRDKLPGCLTQIRNHPKMYKAVVNGEADEELTTSIAADTRIPKVVEAITVDSLEVFAEWQRKIDSYGPKH